MGAFGFAKDTLSQMRLSQLRELARRVGVLRYSNMLRDQLVSAIQTRLPRVGDAETSTATTPSPPDSTTERSWIQPAKALATVEALDLPAPAAPAWIALLPRDPQWSIVRWQLNPDDRERALAAGGQELALRLTDVTDLLDGGAHPHTLQEVLVEAGATEWHLPIPLGDRDYRVELGYRTATGGWYSLVLSSVTRMPAEAAALSDSIVPFSLAPMEHGQPFLSPRSAPGLHERLYQQASAGWVHSRQGSEGLHERDAGLQGAAAAGGHLSGAGPWASGREASGAGMAARQRSFWLVADAELIVYGATDPAATLTVGDQVLPLSSDGTFRLHTSFPDGGQNYPIRALAADGEQKRSITLDFCRTTPHAKVNAKESAVPEWF